MIYEYCITFICRKFVNIFPPRVQIEFLNDVKTILVRHENALNPLTTANYQQIKNKFTNLKEVIDTELAIR